MRKIEQQISRERSRRLHEREHRRLRAIRTIKTIRRLAWRVRRSGSPTVYGRHIVRNLVRNFPYIPEQTIRNIFREQERLPRVYRFRKA